MREAGDFGDGIRELLLQERRSCLPLRIRIGCDDELTNLSPAATIHEFSQLELLRSHAIDRGKHAMEHVIYTLVSRLLKRNDIEWFLDNENHRGIPTPITTNWALLLHGYHLTRAAIEKLSFEIEERFPKGLRVRSTAPEEMEGETLRGFRPNPGELAEFLDDLADLGGEERLHLERRIPKKPKKPKKLAMSFLGLFGLLGVIGFLHFVASPQSPLHFPLLDLLSLVPLFFSAAEPKKNFDHATGTHFEWKNRHAFLG